MVIPPVLERELRSAARYWGTYWLRVLAGVLMVSGLFVLLAVRTWGGTTLSGVTPAFIGALLFGGFHTVLTVTFIWLCPMLTADCLSRERREGTLGLLFLTPLNAWDVVMGKGLAQVLRAFGLWFSAVPFLSVPFLLGGVLWTDFVRAVAIELTVVLVGLSAGFLATSRASRWASAMLLALVWTAVLWLMLLVVLGGVAHAVMLRTAPVGTEMPPPEVWLMIPFAILFASVAYSGVGNVLPGGIPKWVVQGMDASLLAGVVFAVLVFGVTILAVGWTLNRSRHAGRAGDTETAGRSWGMSRLWGPKRTRRWLEVNPILWLQEKSPLLRLGRWVWIALVMLVWAGLWPLSILEEKMTIIGWFLPPLLLLFEALAAAGSFRQEVEEGTLELLLVTPLPPAQMVWGRARALWSTFGPAIGLGMIMEWVFLQPSDIAVWWYMLQGVIGTWLTLPLIGMRCAMRRLSPLLGWLLVLGWGLIAPMMVGTALTVWADSMLSLRGPEVWVLATLLAQLAAAIWWGRMTAWDLRTRSFMKRPIQLKPG